MKVFRLYIALAVLLCFFSCKKVIEDQQRKAAMSFITSGKWMVADYLVDSTSIASEFEGYQFQFHEDRTVTGTKGTLSENGTWLAEVSDYSITSEFPQSGDPLKKLNGHWIIKDSGVTFVKARIITDSATLYLHLTKLP